MRIDSSRKAGPAHAVLARAVSAGASLVGASAAGASSIEDLISQHSAAIDAFAGRASAVSAARWNVARASGKWTPAQEVKHLALGYEAFVRDPRGGAKLRLKGRWWQRQIWHLITLPKILRGGRLRSGVPAPREVRPPEEPGDQATLLAELRACVSEFHQTVRQASEADSRRRVTHPYFNSLSLPQLLRLCAVHVRHHAAFLPEPGSRPG